jgi:hypothetical protein
MKKELIKCEWFEYVSDELLEIMKNALMLGFTVDCQKFGTRYLVNIYK